MFKKEIGKYSTLLSLYLAQSIPMSFFSTVVPVIMRMEQYSLESIGYLQLIKLPWIIKFLWAPLVDRTSAGTRQYRRWILVSELFYAIVIVSIGFFSLQTDFVTIVILMVIAFSASATQDIATDAYAILSLRKEERSLGNSMQSAGNFLGTMVGSGVLLVIYHYWGWQKLLFCLAAFVILALIPVMVRKTESTLKTEISKKRIFFLEFAGFFQRPGMLRHTLLLIFFYSGIIGILTMIKPYFVDLGYSIKEIGFISGIFGTACGVALTLPAGILLRKKGLKKTVFLFASINLAAALYFVFLTYSGNPLYLIYIGVALLWGSYAMSSVFIYTLGMSVVRKGHEGTDFTTQIVLTHLSSLIIAVSSGKLADMLSYRGLFMIEAAVCLGVIILLLLTFKEKTYLVNEYS